MLVGGCASSSLRLGCATTIMRVVRWDFRLSGDRRRLNVLPRLADSSARTHRIIPRAHESGFSAMMLQAAEQLVVTAAAVLRRLFSRTA